MNRLQHETSPYLRQHADNPVDWYPWGTEALERAQTEDKPILLSIGYSACHWCHVMAHESFEDPLTAQIMNACFINIKVDREERPDLDDIYMQAVQALSGHGGWPMTVFLTPQGQPFYGGTYYPPEPRYGMPAFREVLAGLDEAFRERRAEVEAAAANLTSTLNRAMLNLKGTADDLTPALLTTAAERIVKNFDTTYGGFGGAPKFPQPMNLEFLFRAQQHTGNAEWLHMLTFTLDKMAQGGIYDQLGGGFHRYSVDTQWLVPHFEKMLYDNAQLARVYLHAWQVTRNPFYQRIATEIIDYVLREMTAPEGGFYSATDADSDGEEGLFFVWSIAELTELLGADAALAIEYWGVTTRGNFEDHNILSVPNPPEVAAQRLGLNIAEFEERLSRVKDKLFAARTQRNHPLLDDKILTAWNGMMLATLAEAARVLDRDDYRSAAVRAGDFLLKSMRAPDGRLYRTHHGGVSKLNAYLEDYASLLDGLLELYQATFTEHWFSAAQQLADYALAHFAAPDGGFFDTSDDHETLIARPRNLQDNAMPSGTALFAKGLARLAAYTGSAAYDSAARRAIAPLAEALRQIPQAFGEALNVADMLVQGLDEVALSGPPAPELLAVLNQPYRPNQVLAAQPAAAPRSAIALLHDRPALDGQPTVYVCRHFTCALPVHTAAALQKVLEQRRA